MASDSRLELIENVRALLESDPRINGLVLIGSGAVGFRDELSDVDLMAAVVSGLDAVDVGDDLADRLRSALPLYRYLQTPPARAMNLHVFLLESHLELDLSFVSVDELRATDPRWKIVFDRNGEVATRLSLPLPEIDHSDQVRFRYLAGCGALWFGLKALHRGEYLLATHRLAELRGHVLALACLHHFGTDQQAAARADELPKGIRDHVQRLTCVANAAPLTQAFRDAIDTLAMYDQTLLRDELGDTEFSGLAEWLSRKYTELL